MSRTAAESLGVHLWICFCLSVHVFYTTLERFVGFRRAYRFTGFGDVMVLHDFRKLCRL